MQYISGETLVRKQHTPSVFTYTWKLDTFLCILFLTDHAFAVSGGARSALLPTVQSGLHLLHLLVQHLLLLGQLLVTVQQVQQIISQ